METASHRQLKRHAIAFLRHHGCQALATEVQCPLSRWRVDVAGYLDTRPVEHIERLTATAAMRGWRSVNSPGHDRLEVRHGLPDATPATAVLEADHGNDTTDHRLRRTLLRCPPRTILIECKQSRDDFLRDRAELARLLKDRARLEGIRAHLEEHRIKPCEPHLRRSGSALFQELESWDFAASKLGDYRKVLRELRRLEKTLYGQTKFCMVARYRLADRLYLATPAGLLKPHELPPGWGLLECPRRWLHDPPSLFDVAGPPILRVAAAAPERNAPLKFHHALLRNIAVAATRAAQAIGP
jgi:hypothetical protein